MYVVIGLFLNIGTVFVNIGVICNTQCTRFFFKIGYPGFSPNYKTDFVAPSNLLYDLLHDYHHLDRRESFEYRARSALSPNYKTDLVASNDLL